MSASAATTEAASQRRLLTIGTVCNRLRAEFADISISKIRYLEDQGLLTPRRTPGGYRLFSEDDVERLETILRLQRDEFLPLRVIREELSSPASRERKRRRSAAGAAGEEADLPTVCERSGLSGQAVRELEGFGILAPRTVSGDKRYSANDVEIAAACGRMAEYGLTPRHLRGFRTAAENQAGLLKATLAPALRAQSPERQAAGRQDLQSLAEAAQELWQLLFWRDIRGLAG